MSLEIPRASRVVVGCAGPDEKCRGTAHPPRLRVVVVMMVVVVVMMRLGIGRSRKHQRQGEQQKLFHAAILARSGARKRRNSGVEYTELPSTNRLPEARMSLESRLAHPNPQDPMTLPPSPAVAGAQHKKYFFESLASPSGFLSAVWVRRYPRAATMPTSTLNRLLPPR